MKAKELRELSVDELRQKTADLAKEYFQLREAHAAGKLDKPAQLRLTRRAIARAQTILNAKRKEQR